MCESIYRVSLLCLQVNHANVYIEEKNGNKYLTFDSAELRSTDENKEVLKKCNEIWDGIKTKLKQ